MENTNSQNLFNEAAICENLDPQNISAIWYNIVEGVESSVHTGDNCSKEHTRTIVSFILYSSCHGEPGHSSRDLVLSRRFSPDLRRGHE